MGERHRGEVTKEKSRKGERGRLSVLKQSKLELVKKEQREQRRCLISRDYKTPMERNKAIFKYSNQVAKAIVS